MIEKEKGIEEGILISALEDALLAAFKKTPEATRHAEVKLDSGRGVPRVRDRHPRGRRDAARRGRAGGADRRARADRGERRAPAHACHRRGPRPRLVPGPPTQIVRTDVTPTSADRGPDGEAGHPAADPGSGAGDHVRRVRRPPGRGGDGHRPAGRRPQQRARRPRPRRGPAPAVGAGRRRALRAGEPDQGGHCRGPLRHEGPAGDSFAPRLELIRALFSSEVTEIADGLVEIRGVAREPGYRSKIAVESHMQGVDPVGACRPRGSRVRMVVSELRGEKIDIIPWNTEPARFVAKALSPARVREVYIDDETREATVVVPDDQLALAIGKEGLNARLATRLTGLEDRHRVRDRVRAGRGASGLRRERGRRGLLRPLCRDPLERQALPERDTPGVALLRRPRTPGARRHRAGSAARGRGGGGACGRPSSRRGRGRDLRRGHRHGPGRHLSSGRDGELGLYA